MSGKSVYLKSVALITYLAHVGSFVPADAARVGLTDRIFTRIISNDSLVTRARQSSFLRDLNQVSLMANNATERSLCVIDEFGKGTKNSDGVGLLGGLLRYMSGMNVPPKVFVATHFTDVTDAAYVPHNANMRYVTMAVHAARANVNPCGGDDDNKEESVVRHFDVEGWPRQTGRLPQQGRSDQGMCSDNGERLASGEALTFLYKVVPGVSTRAYSLRCAREAGLPEARNQRAHLLA